MALFGRCAGDLTDQRVEPARLLNDIAPRLMSKRMPHRTFLQEKFIDALPALSRRMPRLELVLWSLRLRLSPFRVLAARGTAPTPRSS